MKRVRGVSSMLKQETCPVLYPNLESIHVQTKFTLVQIKFNFVKKKIHACAERSVQIKFTLVLVKLTIVKIKLMLCKSNSS